MKFIEELSFQQIAYQYEKEFNFDPYLACYTRINLKWIIDLNVKSKII